MAGCTQPTPWCRPSRHSSSRCREARRQKRFGNAERADSRRAGKPAVRLVSNGLRPRDILTRKSFEKAITLVIALGGAANAVLHLLVIAMMSE
ncbi:MAG TPA: dihydroxy-acid dehydratase [Steroidobacteraceae bacterium]|nr:dihydroxy-acid dehydratase [Steroidobacteraceae bacterium]